MKDQERPKGEKKQSEDYSNEDENKTIRVKRERGKLHSRPNEKPQIMDAGRQRAEDSGK